jgi:hypothetical protein|tara:strand:+ start:228 stop:449 length:222 start_codon:yes stop_codon:yes gene_type:complete
METFFEIIIALILITYVIRKASPYILAYFLKKLEKKVRNKFTQNNHKDFNYSSKKTATKKEKVGEYVDFEEID